MSLAVYQFRALADPEEGFYARQDPLGIGGHFTTAPEVSQMFGELLGLWALAQWQAENSPGPLRLVELGPGRGTMIADALRAIGQTPGFDGEWELHLVETSPHLLAKQQETLTQALPGEQLERVAWHQDLSALPEASVVFLANEFFDVLPIRQFEKSPQGWHERLVGADESGDNLAFTLGPPLPLPDHALPAQAAEAAPGAVLEFSPATDAIMQELARRIADHDGAALILDYGYWERPLRGSFQALRHHAFCDPLANPGSADLTAHVDFANLAGRAQKAGLRAWGPRDQGDFLKDLGIAERASRLAHGLDPAAQQAIEAALERLTGADAMGRLFKALAITGAGAPPPPGFSA
jgi:NADH dehydrogenase [ubiquinone] 1 alpha subcomplex assembly factor 7